MTKMVRLQISNGHKKSFVEVCKWSCKLEDIVENLDADDEDHQLLKENLKLDADDKCVVMTKEDYDAYDFDNEDGEHSFYDFEDAEFYESSDGCWTDLSFINLHEDVEDIDEDILYDLMRDHGDVEECEITIYGPLEHEIEEEWDEE